MESMRCLVQFRIGLGLRDVMECRSGGDMNYIYSDVLCNISKDGKIWDIG